LSPPAADETSRELARCLHRDVGANGHELTIPTGLVFLMKGLEGPDSHGRLPWTDTWRHYATWHETVHVQQFCVTNWLFGFGMRCTSMAMQALDAEARAEDLRVRRAEYRAELDRYFLRRSGCSVQEIVETHAVVQATMWLLGSREGAAVARFARDLYSRIHPPCPEYVRLLDDVVERFGPDAIEFLPRACALALNEEDPPEELNRALAAFAADATIVQASPLELCSRLDINPAWLARSIRERLADSPLANHPYASLFSSYWEAYETRGVAARLELIMGSSDTWKVFRPIIVYQDGELRLPWTMSPELVPGVGSALVRTASEFVAGERLLL